MDKLTVSKESVVFVDNFPLDSLSLLVEFICNFEESASLNLHCQWKMLFYAAFNCLAWEARLKIEFRSFMVTNFTTSGDAVTEEDEVMADVFRGRR